MKRFFVLLISSALLTGCAATVGRYGVRENEEKEKKPAVVKQEPVKKKKIDTSVPDSLYSAEEGEPADNGQDDDPYNESAPAVMLNKTAEETQRDINAMTDAELQEAILVFLNTRYKYGGTSHEGIDCSAFTMNVYKDRFNVLLKRSAREQYTMGTEVEKENLKEGDLVFFNTRRRVRPGHVGIYIGNNRFVHASTSQGVTVSNLDDSYYLKRYMGARRIID